MHERLSVHDVGEILHDEGVALGAARARGPIELGRLVATAETGADAFLREHGACGLVVWRTGGHGRQHGAGERERARACAAAASAARACSTPCGATRAACRVTAAGGARCAAVERAARRRPCLGAGAACAGLTWRAAT